MRISDWSSDVCSSDLINHLDAAGRPAGIAIDLLRLIEAKTGLSIDWFADRWSVVIDRALRHQVDAAINGDKTPKRQERLLSTHPYYPVTQAVAVRADSPGASPPARKSVA